jgi:ABC-2 type transport system ATP-binding protein
MKQKLSLSCALIHRPEILLLDEPTFGVDPISRRDLWLILHEMVAEGVTIVVSTAYLDEAERCDRVAFLHEGRMLALDTPAALQRVAAGPVLEVRADDPRARPGRLRSTRRVAGLALRRGGPRRGQTGRRARDPRGRGAGGGGAWRVREPPGVEASLEDVFIDRVGAGRPWLRGWRPGGG